jgi:hypothetical protein
MAEMMCSNCQGKSSVVVDMYMVRLASSSHDGVIDRKRPETHLEHLVPPLSKRGQRGVAEPGQGDEHGHSRPVVLSAYQRKQKRGVFSTSQASFQWAIGITGARETPTHHLADMPTIPNLRQPHRVQPILIRPDFSSCHDERKSMQKTQNKEQLAEPLMEHLKFLVRIPGDEGDQVPFGSESEDEGEDA